MGEIMVIFSLAATGCLVRLSADLLLQVFARRLPSGTIASGPQGGPSQEAQPKADPLMTLGLTLASYVAIAAGLVSLLPGDLAIERTWLAIALLCVGGLIGEISRTRHDEPDVDGDADAREPEEPTPTSVGLSVALMLTLSLAIALLISGQGLVQVVPPREPVAQGQVTQLEQIVVVARRSSTDVEESANFL